VPDLLAPGTARRRSQTGSFLGHHTRSCAGSGLACLVSQIHAVELHDLPEPAYAAFMRDARRVSRALAAASGAVKLNYEMHGNSIPHLHMHFFPRYRGDQFEGQPINPRLAAQPVYAPGEFRKLRDAFLAAL
jgi:diadenosine tetraphosphate (Ap4A) HIT family hydrolase